MDCKTLFTEGRTYNFFLPREVADEKLKEIYEIMKMGPTSGNMCPARVLFVKNGPQKEKLLTTVAPMNVDKVKSAPVTAIIAMDEKFYEFSKKLYPPKPDFGDMFAKNPTLAQSTAFRNGSLQGAYFIIAAREVGLDTGPMSGFSNEKLDEAFFSGTSWKSNFICNLGYGDQSKLFPRLPRLSFEEACQIV